jgi:hypothetical protein
VEFVGKHPIKIKQTILASYNRFYEATNSNLPRIYFGYIKCQLAPLAGFEPVTPDLQQSKI